MRQGLYDIPGCGGSVAGSPEVLTLDGFLANVFEGLTFNFPKFFKMWRFVSSSSHSLSPKGVSEIKINYIVKLRFRIIMCKYII